MNILYFAHSNHGHMNHHAAVKGADALTVSGLVILVVVVTVISVMIFDRWRRKQEASKVEHDK